LRYNMKRVLFIPTEKLFSFVAYILVKIGMALHINSEYPDKPFHNHIN
jgi:hypothetical protein